MSQLLSKKGELAIIRPEFKKIEARLQGGVATIAQRTELISCSLVMDSEYNGKTLRAGKDKVVLKGDSGLASFAKSVLTYNGIDFVMVPESFIVGVEIID